MAWLVLLGVLGCSSAVPRQEKFSFPNAPGIIHLLSFGSTHDIDPPSAFREWVIGKDTLTENLTISKPYGIAVTKGKIYINDGLGSSGYWIFDLTKNELNLIGSRQIQSSLGIAVDERNYKYISVPRLAEAKAKGTFFTDKEEGGIVVFDENDRLVQSANIRGRPIGVAVKGDRLFVTDLVNQRIVVVDKHTLKELSSFGTLGSGEMEFRFPKAIAVGEDGRLYVGDTFNGRIKVYTQKGEFVSQYGYRARILGGFYNLSGLAVDKKGWVYAVDSMARMKMVNDEIQMLDSLKFYKKGEKVPPVDSKPEEKKNPVFGYFDKPFGLGDPNAPTSAAITLYKPLDVAIDYENIEYFKDYFPPEFFAKNKIEYLIWLTSQGAYNGNNISVFAYTSEK